MSSCRRKPLLDLSRDLSGSAAIMFGLALVPLSGLTAVAVDYTRSSLLRTEMQAAVDAAALGAVRLPVAEREALASGLFRANTRGAAAMGGVTITQTSLSPDASRLRVTATAQLQTLMSGIIGTPSMTVSVKATAVMPMAVSSAGCFYALDTGANGALRINGGSQIDAPGCTAHVHSNIHHSFIINAQSRFMVERTCVRGTALLNPGYQTGIVDQQCNPDPDPIAAGLPAMSPGPCTQNNLIFNPQATPIQMNPGVYCGHVNFNGGAAEIHFNPGLYVIRGAITFNSGSVVRGTGVTFYFQDQGILQMNGQMQMYLSAPTTGAYAGLLMFQDKNLPKRNFIFNNHAGQKLSGVIWLPTQDIQFNSRSLGADSDSVTVVANTAILNAQAQWRIAPGTVGAATPTGKPRLDIDGV